MKEYSVWLLSALMIIIFILFFKNAIYPKQKQGDSLLDDKASAIYFEANEIEWSIIEHKIKNILTECYAKNVLIVDKVKLISIDSSILLIGFSDNDSRRHNKLR